MSYRERDNYFFQERDHTGLWSTSAAITKYQRLGKLLRVNIDFFIILISKKSKMKNIVPSFHDGRQKGKRLRGKHTLL